MHVGFATELPVGAIEQMAASVLKLDRFAGEEGFSQMAVRLLRNTREVRESDSEGLARTGSHPFWSRLVA